MTMMLSNKNFTWQRQSEPPMLWMGVFLGSVVLHAVAFFSLRLGAVNSVNSVQTQAASVELIEVAPIVESAEPIPAASKVTTLPILSKVSSPNSSVISESSKTVLPTLGNPKSQSQLKSSQGTAKAQSVRSQEKQSVSQVKAVVPKSQQQRSAIATLKGNNSPSSLSTNSTSKLKVSAKSVAVRSPSIKPAPKPTVAVKPVTKRSPIPQPSASVKPTEKRSPSIKPAPKPTVAVKPVAKRSPIPQPSASVKPTEKRSPSIKPAPKPTVAVKPVTKRSPIPKPTASVKPTEKRSQPVRAMPYPTPTPKKRDRQPLPPTPQPSENQHSGFLATFDLGSIRSGDRDIPEQLAVPEQNQRQFPSILDPVKIGLSQDSALILQVLVEIDERGNLTAIKEVNAVENNSPHQSTAKAIDYLGLAKQLLKDWEFHPAYSGGQPVYSELWLRLTVKAL